MRRLIFMASIATAGFAPSIASAETPSHITCEQQSSTRVIATVAGAGAGGVLGNVIAGQGDKTLGTIIGAVGGAIIGNQVAKATRDCDDAYGYYDKDNRWHATGISPPAATGYYNRDGDWMDGPPNGRYGDDNRWISNSGSDRNAGSYSSQGDWVPASANGYYDRNDQWVRGSDSGYYDNRGLWIASGTPVQSNRREDAYGYYDSRGMWHANSVSPGRASGYYDRDNNWVQGTPNGYYDERGNWVPQREDGSASGAFDSQNRWIPSSSNGYYDNNGQWVAGTASGYYDRRGRWVAGATVGHYDANGRWMAGAASGRRDESGAWIADPQPGYYDTNGRWHAGQTSGYYDSRGRWISTTRGAAGVSYTTDRPEVLSQLAQLDRHVVDAKAQRTLTNREAYNLQRELRSIRNSERNMQHDRTGNLSARNEAELQTRIDRLNNRLRVQVQ